MNALSDCFVISDSGALAYTIVARAQELAFTMLEQRGVICRGAIVLDDFHHRDGIAFGPALVKAVALETDVARCPRIVVDEPRDELLRMGTKPAKLSRCAPS